MISISHILISLSGARQVFEEVEDCFDDLMSDDRSLDSDFCYTLSVQLN
jgi:hypothetical protein